MNRSILTLKQMSDLDWELKRINRGYAPDDGRVACIARQLLDSHLAQSQLVTSLNESLADVGSRMLRLEEEANDHD